LSNTALGVRPGASGLSLAQRDVQAVGEESDEDVRFDAVLKVMVDLQIVLEVLERGFDLDELDVELPQLGRILVAQIGAEQIAPLAGSYLSQLVAVERKGEGGILRGPATTSDSLNVAGLLRLLRRCISLLPLPPVTQPVYLKKPRRAVGVLSRTGTRPA